MQHTTSQPTTDHPVEQIAWMFRLPTPWSLAEFIRWVGRARNREIVLMPTKMSHDLCGLWIAKEQADYIAYEQHTSGPHAEHIILHELGHMVLDHRSKHLTGRARYSDSQESDAEVFATAIQQRAGQTSPPPPPAALRRIAESLDLRSTAAHGLPARPPGARYTGRLPPRFT